MVIRVSRHGMTRCTSCDRHIRLEAVIGETRCPFCGGALTVPAPARGVLGAMGRSGGALAASLMSFGLGAACLDERAGARDVNDGADATMSDTAVEDTTSQPLYGLPMDATVETAEDTTPQPEYGLPMDVSEPDATQDTGASDDIPIQPLYGGPPPADAFEPADADDAQDADGNVPVPLYGQPPGG